VVIQENLFKVLPMSKDVKSFLGTGWGFPPTFNKQTKSVNLVEGEEDVLESIKIILFTNLGERVMRPDFGSDIKIYTFKTMDAVVINQLNRTVERALMNNEPRINVNHVEFDTSNAADGTLLINLDYTIKSVNVRTNAVFPFYLKEGTYITDL
tara:strand:+ start:445 stop:903 length:459 start_codon:yes stop_codon:yes gene_type:complete